MSDDEGVSRGYKLATLRGIVKDSGIIEHTDVPLNACVVKSKDGFCAVFVTTDTKKSATDIIKTYELRPEIEENSRQIKDFWRIEDFKSRSCM